MKRAIYIGKRRERNFGPMTYGMTGWLTEMEWVVNKGTVSFKPDCREIGDWFLPIEDFYIPPIDNPTGNQYNINMIETLTGTYVWTVNVSVKVHKDATDEEKREALDRAAKNADLDLSHPILHECSNPDLID